MTPGRAREAGYSLIEVMVAALITTMVAAVFFAIFSQFSNDALRQERRGNALAELRPAVAELIIELRQAVDVDGNPAIVGTLDADWSDLNLVFYSDRFADTEGPERFRYFLTNCDGELCELQREVTAADPGTGPDWEYTGTPVGNRVLSNVLTDGPEPLFSGVSWRGGTEDITLVCGTSPTCLFEVLRIRLRVDPEPGRENAVIEIDEDVRFRNATS